MCITKNTIKLEVANCLVIFPPQSLCSEQRTSVRVLQLNSNLGVVSLGMFMTYLSATCDKATGTELTECGHKCTILYACFHPCRKQWDRSFIRTYKHPVCIGAPCIFKNCLSVRMRFF